MEFVTDRKKKSKKNDFPYKNREAINKYAKRQLKEIKKNIKYYLSFLTILVESVVMKSLLPRTANEVLAVALSTLTVMSFVVLWFNL